jgi:hypothetical protein
MAPDHIADVMTQRLRWAMGALQILMRDNPLRLVRGPHSALCFWDAVYVSRNCLSAFLPALASAPLAHYAPTTCHTCPLVYLRTCAPCLALNELFWRPSPWPAQASASSPALAWTLPLIPRLQLPWPSLQAGLTTAQSLLYF